MDSNQDTQPDLHQEEKEEFLGLYPTSRWKRFANNFIDYFCFTFLYIVILSFLFVILGLEQSLLMSDLTVIIFLLAIYLLYYIILETKSGRTIGKYTTGTIVIDRNGNIPTIKTALIRALCRLIPLEPVSFLLSDRNGLHDVLSNTRVVNVKEWRAEQEKNNQ